MEKEKLAHLKWLWNSTNNYEILESVVAAICRSGDIADLKWLWDATNRTDWRKQVANAIIKTKGQTSVAFTETVVIRNDFDYDFFICHASEDKESCVRELAENLRKKGFRV